MSYIRFENLSKSFGKNEVLTDINLEVEKGQLVTLLGPSGCGKSTLLRCLAGLETVTSGRVYLDGEDITDKNPKDRDIGMVFQQYSLFPNMDVAQNVAFGLKMKKVPKEEITKRVEEMVDIVGLSDHLHHYPAEMSGGQQQRAALARAMVTHPKVLLLDEPLSAIDALLRHSLQVEIRRIQKEMDITAIFVTHDQDEAMVMSDVINLMYQGKIVETGYTEEVLYHPKHEYTKHLIAAIPRNQEDTREDDLVMTAKDLNVYYSVKSGGIFGKRENKHVLQNVDFFIRRGEILGLVGESGCGKSTLAKCIVGLNKNYTGTLDIRESHPQLVFQDPYSSLNPMKKIGWILEEPLKVNGMKDKAKRKTLAEQMLVQVGLDASFADRYPSELSGGQRQRISIGSALILNSKFIVADEPVSALDVTVQSQVLNLLLDLHRSQQLTYLFISHDLNIVRHFCNRVIVMYLGEIVEEAEVEEIYEDPKHPYTQLLFHSILTDERKLQKITDSEQSREDASGEGCPFYQRCTGRCEICRTRRPERKNISSDKEHPHWVKCFKY